MLQPFVVVINFNNQQDQMYPMERSLGLGSVSWMTLKARTNGFTIATGRSSIDGFRIAEGGSIDFPISDLVFKSGQNTDLSDLYWSNTTLGQNAVIEVIGSREV